MCSPGKANNKQSQVWSTINIWGKEMSITEQCIKHIGNSYHNYMLFYTVFYTVRVCVCVCVQARARVYLAYLWLSVLIITIDNIFL